MTYKQQLVIKYEEAKSETSIRHLELLLKALPYHSDN